MFAFCILKAPSTVHLHLIFLIVINNNYSIPLKCFCICRFFEIEEENEQDKTSEPTAEIVQQSLLPDMVDSYFVPEQPKPSPPKTFLAPNVKPRSHELNREGHNVKHQDQMKLAKSTKIICTLDLLLDIFQEKCRHPTCNDKVYTKHTLIGTCVVIEWKCHSGHAGKFYSSYDCNKLAATNLQTAASILLSGNNFYKMEKFARFLGLSFISSSTFFRFQSFIACQSLMNGGNGRKVYCKTN